MTVWRYTAVATGGETRRGELAADTAADLRASLRRIGLHVIEHKPIRRSRVGNSHALQSLTTAVSHHLRKRRTHQRAEFFDGLATMLDAGLPMLEAVDAIIDSESVRRSALRSMLVQLRDQLRSGNSLSQAMVQHDSWFDLSDVAMARAGQHSGELTDVLRSLAERHERSGELTHKLISALVYPAIITVVAVGVVVFLSVKTLPQLTDILINANQPVPRLTSVIMGFGQLLAGHWLVLLTGVACVPLAVIALRRTARSFGLKVPRYIQQYVPRVFRTMAIAQLSLRLAELIRTGVPVVEALRVVAPTTTPALATSLRRTAESVEHGEDLAGALNDDRWFDAQFRRLIEIGQTAGDLHEILQRIGQRAHRQSTRLIDRLAALLEPVVILILASLIGVVVVASILPLIRLQEVI